MQIDYEISGETRDTNLRLKGTKAKCRLLGPQWLPNRSQNRLLTIHKNCAKLIFANWDDISYSFAIPINRYFAF
jgi:hypothetical protein